MEKWGFLFSVMSSPIVYFLTILLAVCPNINPTILCAHVCDVNYAACYFTRQEAFKSERCVFVRSKSDQSSLQRRIKPNGSREPSELRESMK